MSQFRSCSRLPDSGESLLRGVSGSGVGGSCFPKDSLALNYLACQNGIDLHILQATINSNQQRFVAMANKIKQKIFIIINFFFK